MFGFSTDFSLPRSNAASRGNIMRTFQETPVNLVTNVLIGSQKSCTLFTLEWSRLPRLTGKFHLLFPQALQPLRVHRQGLFTCSTSELIPGTPNHFVSILKD
jgi:hypothetical protein